MKVKKTKLLLLSILSGVLLSAAWPAIGNLDFLIFVAFVPLLMVEHIIDNNRDRFKSFHFFNYAYLSFLIWNVITTWWIYYASAGGMVMAIIFNALFMAVVALLFHVTKKKLGARQGYVGLIVYWLAFEYIHLSWDITWPWLTLGNVFASSVEVVQWYEFTGVMGGTVWVLLINMLIFNLIKQVFLLQKPISTKVPAISVIAFFLIAPITYSLIRYFNYSEKDNPVNVTVVQPNIDPYGEKFNEPWQVQLQKMNDLALPKITQETDYVVFPETALPQGIWENELQYSQPLAQIREFIQPFPNLKYITGLVSYREYQSWETPSETARPLRGGDSFYDVFNTAMQVDSSSNIQLYHKSKLVPGVEKMPFPSLLGFLEHVAIDLGGMTGSHGIDQERSVFSSIGSDLKIAPVICYESIYAEYIGGYVQNGAGLIFIITNDGWWENTPGYKQHLMYARLKSISNRRSIARSANTGTSAFINQRGDVSQPTNWWEEAVISEKINSNDEITFYVRHGDYLARAAILVSLLLLLWTISKSLNKTQQRLGL
jgi:apolipoprotein N-acyltransferase